MTNRWRSAALLRIAMSICLLLGFTFALVRRPTSANADRQQNKSFKSGRDSTPEPSTPKAPSAYGNLPLAFVPNFGQLDARVRYTAQAGNTSFYFTPKDLRLVSRKGGSGLSLRLSFIGANPAPDITSTGALSGLVNYLVGNDPAKWRTGIRTSSEIVYRNLWPGIDLRFGSDGGSIKYELHVAPGANPDDIRLAYNGADRLSLDEDGDLQIHTSLGTLEDSRPISYQIINGKRVAVESSYTLEGTQYGFELGRYNPNGSLVIDPLIAYSTFVGAAGNDSAFSIAVDASGSAYITGVTVSSSFPTTTGAFNTTFNGGTGDVFVTKLDPSGSALVYSTYLGGSLNDQGNGIDVDGEGNAYVTGSTTSTNFPTTPDAFDTAYNSGIDAFVTKLNADGSNLIYSTYLGGSLAGTLCSPFPCPHDSGLAIAVDVLGNAYVTGSAGSRDFPTTPEAFDTTYVNGSGSTIFLTKLNAAGSALIYSTFLGVSGSGTAIAVGADGSAYVTGNTVALHPTTPGAFDTDVNDAFVTKFNADGNGLLYSTYLGGSGADDPTGIAIDIDGNAFVTGTTNSFNFPTTDGAFDGSLGAGQDAFVVKLNSFGTDLVYGTYLGGGSSENCWAIAVDGIGNAYVTGQTTSVDFPTTPTAFDSTFNGGTLDVFVTALNSTGSGLAYSTYFGGGLSETGRGVAVDSSGGFYVTGIAASSTFPTTPGSFDTTFAGGVDAFVIKLSNRPPQATADTAITDEDISATIDALANDSDPDTDALAVSEVTQGSNGTVTINVDNTLTYTPAANFYGTDSFTYTLIDTFGVSDIETVTITINPINDPPVANDSSSTTNEDEPVEINLSASDVDNTELTFSIVSSPANGTLSSINGAIVTYTPHTNFFGSDTFTFKANDGMADSNIATVTITVAAVNDPPDAVEDSASTNEEVPLTINVLTNDADVESNTLTVIGVGQGSHGVVTINPDGTINYTPVVNYFGPDSFTYDISDSNGGTDSATVNISVANVQDAPSANDDEVNVLEDSSANPINVLANDSDVDGDSLAITLVTQGLHGAVVNNGTSVSYTPAPNYFGADSFTYTVSDGQGGTSTATVNVTVTNINDAPVANSDSYSVDANTNLVVPAPGVLSNDVDVDGDVLSAVLVTNTANGTLQLASEGSFTYTPNLNYRGPDSFTYRASDGTADSNVVTVQISVLNGLILFVSTRDGNPEIYTMHSNGSNQIRLTNHPAMDAFPAWSPSGTQIAFVSNREGSFEIYLMDADGSSPTRLTTNALVDGKLSWSPDGTRIAFTSGRDGNAEIYVINVDGSGLTRVTKNKAIDLGPSWSPDGTKIAFSSDRKRSFEIHVMNADGSGVIQLTKNGFADVGADWSTDGTRIAFSSNRDGNFEIYLMNADGSALVRLTNNAASDDEPAWIAGGSKIVFTSQRDGNSEIYLMNSDGTGLTRLTVNPAGDTSPD